MLVKWELWSSVAGAGLAIALAGWAGRWGGAPGAAADYSRETTWAIGVGCAVVVIGIVGVLAAYVASRKVRDAEHPPDVHITSNDQRGGYTAHTINISREGNSDDREG